MAKEEPNKKRKIQASEDIINNFIFTSFWKRLFAWIIDSIIISTIVIGLIYLLTTDIPTSIEAATQRDLNLITQSIVIANLIYYTILEGSISQTIGKKILGIKVYKVNGEKIGFSYALVRRIGLIVPFLNLIDGASILFTSKNQRIFDIVASTIVIDSKIEDDVTQFLEGKGLTPKLREKIENSRGKEIQKVNKEKILANLKEKKNDLEKKFEQGEVEKSDYQNIKSRYETRINQLENELNKEEKD